MTNLPFPPLEMRKLVGPTDPKDFDNPEGLHVFADIPLERQTSVFDFGCGCGRIARMLIQQNPPPKRYVGIDLHQGMIKWCQNNLKPHASSFEFLHHDVFNVGFNPLSKTQSLPFPMEDKAFQLVLAWSVFTHILETQILFYLKEVARILAWDGTFISTWFTFDKQLFPMMQSFQNALYINTIDPSNAVIVDRNWLKSVVQEAGLQIVKIDPPGIRGFQWRLQMTHLNPELPTIDFPADLAPIGLVRPPLIETDPSRI